MSAWVRLHLLGNAFLICSPERVCVLFRKQASFLQTNLPLHVALTKHKVYRRTIPQGRRPRPGVEGGHDEDGPREHEGGCDDVDELPASGVGLSRSRGELVGTAEVDWR